MLTVPETRSQTIVRHLEAYQKQTGKSWPSVAQMVVEQFARQVPPQHRAIEFHDTAASDDPYEAMRANAQILRRIREGEVRFPADLEEAVVAALPDPCRQNLLDDLAAHYGLLAVKAPTFTETEDGRNLAHFWKEAGEAAEAVLAMLEDNGRIGPEDRDKAGIAVAELDDVIREAATMKSKIINACGVEP